MIYDVNYFIKKFEAISEKKFISGDWGDPDGHCAGGHCGLNGNNCDEGTQEAVSLAGVLSPLTVTSNTKFGFDEGYFWWIIPAINDGSTKEYQQPTPKARILAALYDIRAKTFLEGADLHGCELIKAFEPAKNSRGKKIYNGLFKCKCGKEFVNQLEKLKSGNTKSCGCFRKEWMGKTFIKHGMAGTPLYQCWFNMIGRCGNPNHKAYKYYGGRGITVCEEWVNDFEVFRKWALSNGWSKELTLDRYPNNDGNYEPGNCRWATMKQQHQNKRQKGEHKEVIRYVSVPSSITEQTKELIMQ